MFGSVDPVRMKREELRNDSIEMASSFEFRE
jgi:hypothetical protein